MLLFTCNEFSPFLLLWKTKESYISFPTSCNKPKTRLVTKECDIRNLMLNVQSLISHFVKQNSTTVDIMNLDHSSLECYE